MCNRSSEVILLNIEIKSIKVRNIREKAIANAKMFVK